MSSPFKKRRVGSNVNQAIADQHEQVSTKNDPEESVNQKSNLYEDEDDEDGYAEFLLSLIDTNPSGQKTGKPNSRLAAFKEDEENEEEEEYRLDDDDDDEEEDEEEDEDEDDESERITRTSTTTFVESVSNNHNNDASWIRSEEDNDDEDSWTLDPQELEDELGDLLQEDMEAAISALLQHSSNHIPVVAHNKRGAGDITQRADYASDPQQPKQGHAPILLARDPIPGNGSTTVPIDASNRNETTPLTRSTNPPLQSSHHVSSLPIHKVVPTQTQWNRLQQLMNKQYQLLVQQTVLAVRAAHTQKAHKETKKVSDSSQVSTSHPPNLQAKRLSTVPSHYAPFNKMTQKNHLPLHLPFTTHAHNKPFYLPTSNPPFPGHAHVLPTPKGLHPPASSTPSYPDFFLSGESPDEIAEVLDTAAGMLQDLEQNRKDALRYALQMQRTQNVNMHDKSQLTRAAFVKALQTGNDVSAATATVLDNYLASSSLSSHGNHPTLTTFDVKGLDRLYDTFAMIDNSVIQASSGWDNRLLGGRKDFINVLKPLDHGDACEFLLQHAQADFDRTLLPGRRDLLSLFTYPLEIYSNLDEKIGQKEELVIRKSRNLFTAGEDNLLLRGVNLYGEKEWSIISNRYMPERGVNLISQRHSKLCVILYEAHGIRISDDGDLDPPADSEHGEIDDSSIAHLIPATAPVCMNVHRWSLEEDITILKAVPLIGNYWADISSLLVPHRERGHLRKRYQVLERRVKATAKRRGKIPPLCDQSKTSSSELPSNKGKRKSSKTETSQPTSSKKAKKKDTVINDPRIGQAGQVGRGMIPPNQPLLKGIVPIRPFMPGNSHFSNSTPKYVPHGFTARPLYSLVKQPPNSVQLAIPRPKPVVPSISSNKYSQSVIAPTVQILHHKSKETIVSQNIAISQDNRSDRQSQERIPLTQERLGKQDPSASPSASSFHFSPSSMKLSQIECMNSPSWLTPRDSGLSYLPNGNTTTSLERLMQVEGFSQMWNETNDDVVNQTMGVKLPKSHNDDILASQNQSTAAPNDTWNDHSNGPDMEALGNSCSGLSLLKDAVSPDPKKKCRSSILSSVLAYTNKGNHDEVQSDDPVVLSSFDPSTSRVHGIVGASRISSTMNHPVGFSLDGIDVSNMSFYEGSRLQRFDDIGGFTILDDQGIPVCNSLLPTEFDAVAVLNQMSSSNLQLPFETSNKIAITAETKALTSDDEEGRKSKGSLFSKVVNGVQDKRRRTGR